MRAIPSPWMDVGLTPGVLDGGRVPPISSSGGEISSCVRFLEMAKGLMVVRAVAGIGMGLGAGSVDMMDTTELYRKEFVIICEWTDCEAEKNG